MRSNHALIRPLIMEQQEQLEARIGDRDISDSLTGPQKLRELSLVSLEDVHVKDNEHEVTLLELCAFRFVLSNQLSLSK